MYSCGKGIESPWPLRSKCSKFPFPICSRKLSFRLETAVHKYSFCSHEYNFMLDRHACSLGPYLPSGVSVASEARPIIAFYSRFRDNFIYIYIYLSASALCKTVHTLHKSYHIGCCAFGTLAAVRCTTLRSRSFIRYGWREPRRRQRLQPYVYNYRT